MQNTSDIAQKVTFIVCTCDDYEDAWNPLFTLIKRYWKGFDLQVVLNTETNTYEHDGFNILSPELYKLHPNPKQVSWSERLYETIYTCINTEYLILFLDDFYLQSAVNIEKLNKCIEVLDAHPNVANIQLFTPPPHYKPFKELEWLVIRKRYSPYYVNLQAGLWRTSCLLRFLRKHETPWHFERWGSIRNSSYKYEVLALNPSFQGNMVFDYNPIQHGLTGGKWRYQTKELFNKEKIDIDINLRGIYNPDDINNANSKNYIKSLITIYKSLTPWQLK